MKTKQGKAVQAYVTLQMMGKKQINNFTAYKLYRLKKDLQQVVEFQSEQEEKLIQELGGTVENGQLNVPEGKGPEFNQKHRELEEMECEIDRDKITIWMKELPQISISEMEALDEFVDWKE